MMRADGNNEYIMFGNNNDVLQNVVKCYERWRNQPSEIVADLRTLNISEQCYAIFCYVIDNVQYQVDKAGYQFIKSPARLLTDGVGDCKSMTIFIASCLHCLGVKHTIRFVNFDGGKQYSHVYPIAYDEQGEMIIIDCVERDSKNKPIYNYARPYEKNKDITYQA